MQVLQEHSPASMTFIPEGPKSESIQDRKRDTGLGAPGTEVIPGMQE